MIFKNFYLFIFTERGREGDREGEKHQCVVASRLAHNPGMCPDQESNWRPFDSQPALNPQSYTSQSCGLNSCRRSPIVSEFEKISYFHNSLLQKKIYYLFWIYLCQLYRIQQKCHILKIRRTNRLHYSRKVAYISSKWW